MQIVMPFYNNPGMLEQHFREWRRYEHPCELILVDDGSATPPDLTDCPIPFQHFRILVDIPWNQNGAHNLGMRHAEGWCLMTDIDHALTAENLERAIAMPKRQGQAYRPRRIWPDGTDREKRHPNTYLIHAEDFWRAGGYDEQFCGYYGTDATFRRQIKASGIRIIDSDEFDVVLYEGIIPDAITRGLGRKGSKYHSANHPKVRKRMRNPTRPSSWLQFPWERVQ